MPNFSKDPISTEQTILQHVENLMNAGSWIYDIKEHSFVWSDGVFRMLGYAPQSFAVTPEIADSIIHPADRDRVTQHKKEVIEHRAEYNITKRLITKEGKSRTVQSKATLLKDELGSSIKLVGVYHDITDFIEIQQNLDEAKQTSRVLLENADGIFWEADANTLKFTYVSPQTSEITGYSPEEWLHTSNFWVDHIHPSDRDFAVNYCLRETKLQHNHVFDYRFRTKNGSYIWLHDRVKVITSPGRPTKLTGLMVDVTADYFYDELDTIEKRLLQRAIQQDVHLKDLIDTYLQELEKLFPEMRATVLKVQNGALYSLSAPSFPPLYGTDVNGLAIGLNQGSCGTAAFLKEKVIVGNVYEDERWENFKSIADTYGFSACWSQPILNADHEVLATFALYYNKPKFPSPFEEFAIERSQRLISLVITKFEYLENLKGSNERYHLINRATKDAIYDWEIEDDKLFFGEGYGRLFGYTQNVDDPIPLEEWSNKIHPEDIERVNRSLQHFMQDVKQHRWEISYQYKRSDGSYAYVEEIGQIIRSTFGRPLRMVGVMRDYTETRELQKLLDNASTVAKIGGWELNLLDRENDRMFWSEMTRKILEVNDNVSPSLSTIRTLVRQDAAASFQSAIEELINNGTEFDLELAINVRHNVEKWVRIIGKSERRKNKCYKIYGSIQDVHHEKNNQLELSRKNRLLDTLSIIISEFLQVDDWRSVLHSIFELTGQTAEVDRVYYLELHPDPETGVLLSSQRFEWAKAGIHPEIDNPDLQQLPVHTHPEFFTPLLQGLPVQLITSKLKSDKLRSILEEQSIKSCLALPIMVDNNCWGLIGFDDCNEERYFTESEIVFLINVTANMATAIQRYNNRIQLEKALSERNTILESIGDGFCAIDRYGKITYWNKQAEQIFNLPRQQVEDKSASEVFYQILQLTDVSLYQELLLSKEKKSIEYHNPVTNQWFDLVIYPSLNGRSVFFRDITIRKKAETEIRQSNERFEIITRATNDAIWDYDVEKNKLFWGQGFFSLFGYKVNEVNPSFELLVSLIHPEDRRQVVKKIQKYMSGEIPSNTWEEEYRFLKANGEYAVVLDKAVFIRNKNEQVIRALGAMSDISHRKQYETSLKELNVELENKVQELAISNQELEQFAYVASHDLQEPLRMVTGFLTQLEKKYQQQLDEKAHQYIYFATDGAKRMRQIILDLLDFSRIGKHTEKPTKVNLNEVIREAVTLNQNLVMETNGTVTFQLLPTILSFYSPLLQVFQNLIANALKYSKAEVAPRIEISAEEKEQYWQISVKDNGIGIASEYHERIFIIFQRLHKRDEFSGTGIGLAIVKKIIENLGGKIMVESEPGTGSVFHFTIPKTTNIRR